MATSILQEKILEIYKEIKRICEMHELRYYAIGGTAIGTVRHSGFIPWDDDIDIAMPWVDYQKFLDFAQEELPNNFKLRISHATVGSSIFFDKVQNIDTSFIEIAELNHPGAYKGIFVDIMPLFGVTANTSRFRNLCKMNLLIHKLHNKKKSCICDMKTAKAKMMWVVSYPINMLVPMEFWYHAWLKLVANRDFDSSEYTGYLWSSELSNRLLFPTLWFEDYVEMPFEDTIMRLPIGYNEMLTKQFGNYMMPPSDEDRKTHSGGIVDVDRSYKFYQKEYSMKGTLEEYLK